MKNQINRSELRSLLMAQTQEAGAFVIYHKPESNTLVTWTSDAAELITGSRLSEPGFVFSPFDSDLKSVLLPLRASRVTKTPLQPLNAVPSDKGNDSNSSDQERERIRHIKLVRSAVHEIQSGKAQKIVVSRKEEVFDLEVDPLSVLIRMISEYPKAYTYVWFHPETGYWAGASPETLVEAEDGRFLTMSLAGTQRYSENAEVQWGEKEQEEQRMVTDLIQKELGSMLEHIGEPFTERAGQLLHLRTDLRGSLNEKERLTDLIGRLHPTAAICGLPRNNALEFILTHEGYPRSFYTGFLGEVNYPASGSAHLFVNLRCMRLFPEQKKSWIYVGGGITSQSDPLAEWEETRAKSETMKRVLS